MTDCKFPLSYCCHASSYGAYWMGLIYPELYVWFNKPIKAGTNWKLIFTDSTAIHFFSNTKPRLHCTNLYHLSDLTDFCCSTWLSIENLRVRWLSKSAFRWPDFYKQCTFVEQLQWTKLWTKVVQMNIARQWRVASNTKACALISPSRTKNEQQKWSQLTVLCNQVPLWWSYCITGATRTAICTNHCTSHIIFLLTYRSLELSWFARHCGAWLYCARWAEASFHSLSRQRIIQKTADGLTVSFTDSRCYWPVYSQ